MKKSITFLSSVLLVVLCLTISSFAQQTTGTIEGTTKDANGAIVPNASVTVTGVDVGFNRTVQSNDDGTFRLQQVPPGTYKVTVGAISGFPAQTRENVVVGINNLTTVDFQLAATTGAEVIITGGENIIDTTGTKSQTNISAQQIDDLPKGTGFTSLLRTSVAVRPEPLSGQFSINGSTGPENSFLIDGQETQNYKNGLLNTNNDIPYQAIQEIQVKSSGFEAEFGGATGGVINAVTKSGSNTFRGEFGLQFITQKLNAGPRPVASTQLLTTGGAVGGQGFEYLPQQRDSGTNTYPTALVSGPIVKDKVWFFAIHSPRIINVSRTTNFITGFGTTRAPATIPAAIAGAATTQTASEKLTYNFDQFRIDASPIDTVRIFSSFTWNPIVDRGALLGGTYVLAAPTYNLINGQPVQGADLAALGGGRQNSNNFRIEGVWTPTSKLVFNARYTRGFQNQKLASYGLAADARIICQSVPNANLAASGCGLQGFQSNRGNDVIQRDVSVRTTIDANLTYSVNGLLGSHEFKGGYQNSKIFNDILTGNLQTGGRTYLYYGRNTFNPQNVYVQWNIGSFPGAAGGIYPAPTLAPGVSVIGTGITYQFGASGAATNTANTFFVQDKWQPTSRLTFNLGLRTEREKIPAYNANARNLEFPFKDKLAPRLGVAYALTGDGKTKVSAFYGRFFDRLKFSLPQGSFGGNFYHVSYFYITSDKPGFQNYTVANLKGNFAFPSGGVCPINGGTTTGGTAYVCDQDYRIPSNGLNSDPLTTGSVDPNVKPYRQSEATFEFQREVMRTTVLTARYLWRNLDQVIEDAGVPTDAGEAYVIGNPGQGLALDVYNKLGYNKAPKAKRNYKALQLELDSRFIKNLNFNLNYTLSRLYGNYSGLAGPDELTAAGGSRNDPNVLRDFDEPWVGFTATGQESIGILPLDRTHAFKASGTYTYDWSGSKTNSTDFSFFTTIQSGTPLTSFVNIFGIPIPETKRGDLGRTPMFTQTDLNLSHRYRFGSDNKYTVAVDFNVLNIFNENNILAVNQNKSSGYFALAEEDVCGAGCSTKTATNILTANGVLNQYNSAVTLFNNTSGGLSATNVGFNQPIAFQTPREVRFGFRFLF